MSLKSELLTAYDNMRKDYETAKQDLSFIRNDKDLTVEAIDRKVFEYIQEKRKELIIKSNNLVSRAEKKITELNVEEHNAAVARSTDSNYNALLNQTLELIKNIGLDCDKAALKERLKPFENDKVAISAIRAALGIGDKNPSDKVEAKERGRFLEVVPEDNTGKRQEHIKQVFDAYVKVAEHFADELKAPLRGSFNTAMMINGAVAYVMGCNEDLTKYDSVNITPEQQKKEQQQREAEEKRKNPPLFAARTNPAEYEPTFDFNFTKVR